MGPTFSFAGPPQDGSKTKFSSYGVSLFSHRSPAGSVQHWVFKLCRQPSLSQIPRRTSPKLGFQAMGTVLIGPPQDGSKLGFQAMSPAFSLTGALQNWSETGFSSYGANVLSHRSLVGRAQNWVFKLWGQPSLSQVLRRTGQNLGCQIMGLAFCPTGPSQDGSKTEFSSYGPSLLSHRSLAGRVQN